MHFIYQDSKDHVDFENYRHVVHKWHFKIAKALVVCLESKDYVQIRNALIILTKILPHFPVIVKLNGVIEKRIEKVCEEEKESRKDLYIKAMSYSGQLKVIINLIHVKKFHTCREVPKSLSEPCPQQAVIIFRILKFIFTTFQICFLPGPQTLGNARTRISPNKRSKT